MTPERARELLGMVRYGDVPMSYVPAYKSAGAPTDPRGLTEAEQAFVGVVWETMPGTSCFMDALRRVAAGAEETSKT